MTMPPEAAKGAAKRVVGGAVGEDLTRRGGVVGAKAKALAVEAVAEGGSFVQDLIAGAEEAKVTLVGLFDRADLDLAWTSEGGREEVPHHHRVTMGPKEQKTKEQKAKAAMSWSKGKVKEKANNAVLLDKATLEKLNAEVPKYKMITPSILVDRMRVNGSLARYCINMLWKEGKIKPVSKSRAQWIFTRDTSA